jgi:hypothetical protein
LKEPVLVGTETAAATRWFAALMGGRRHGLMVGEAGKILAMKKHVRGGIV